MEILSVEGCRNIDNFTIKNIGIPSIVLMENVASKISDEINNMGDTVTIFCGIGNNGGDGLAIARKLYLAGKNVEIVLLGNEAKASEEVKVNLNIVRNLNIKITKIVDSNKKDYLKQIILDSDYVVDALFGVGLIVNIDIPDFVKKENSEKTYILSESDYKNFIPRRKTNGHKGNYGKVLVIAGSEKYSGAAYIVTESSVRTGSGLVTLLTHNSISSSLRSKLIESMIMDYLSYKDIKSFDGFDIIACGPGLDVTENSKELLKRVIKETKCNLVLDADALNIISENKDLLKEVSGRAILTPHPGEMARLTNKTIKEIEEDRINIAKTFAKENNVILLLKGYNTIITDGEEAFINPTGNSKMASGGMGDCLAGIITSFCGQKLTLLEGALLGAYIHGLIGDKLSDSNFIVNARDIIENLPKTIQELCEK